MREGGREGGSGVDCSNERKERKEPQRLGDQEEEREGGFRPLMGSGKVTVLTVALTPFPSPEIVASAPYPTPDTVAPAPCPTPDRVFPAPVRSRVDRVYQFQSQISISRKKKKKFRKKGGRGKISPLATPFPTPLTSLFPIAFPVSFTVVATSPTAESVVRLIFWTVSFVNFPTFVVASLEVCVVPVPA